MTKSNENRGKKHIVAKEKKETLNGIFCFIVRVLFKE